MTLAYFTVTGQYQAFVGQQFGKTAPTPVTGTVIFMPLIVAGGTLKTSDARLALQPVQAVIKAANATAEYGEIWRDNAPGCQLVANVDIHNIDSGKLFYTAKFVDMRASDGSPVAVREFTFEAPTTGGGTFDLATAAPAVLAALGTPTGATGSTGATGATAARVGDVDGGTP